MGSADGKIMVKGKVYRGRKEDGDKDYSGRVSRI